MTSPRGLSEDEARAWAKLAASVVPFEGKESPPLGEVAATQRLTEGARREAISTKPVAPRPLHHASRGPASPNGEDQGLDASWERKLRSGTLAPDFTLDLHDHSLDAAWQRLLGGLDLAREAGARVVLVIAGRARPVEAADRSGARGAIRAKILDWLAASRHAAAIAAIRKAHRRHGGEGALYVILKRPR